MAKLKPSVNRLSRTVALAVLLGLLLVLALIGRDRQSLQSGDFRRYNNKQFQVHQVIDGDTIDLDSPDGDKLYTRVRLWGVDTPETKAPGKPLGYFGREATAFTEEMVAGRTVIIEIDGEKTRGKFGRLLGFVYTAEGKMLNEELLRSGHAYADGRWRHRFYFRFGQIEKQARKNKRGLWLNVKAQDMPPHVRKRLGISE
ncbi:MAG: thermonuclease family protein [Phycisphaerae bacterium]|nr:thermonuclease family protein [Phycisphaerae bacterium]